MVSLVDVEGSAPREPGARLIVTARGIHGTIGGGALEWRAIAEAQARLGKGPSASLVTQALGPELGQCCGGRVLLTIERFGAADREAIAPLAAAERGGVLTTIGTVGIDGRLSRRVAAAGAAATKS